MAGDDLGEAVVGQCRQLDGSVGIEHLHARRGEREDVHGHAVLVHLGEAPAFQVQEPLQHVPHAPLALGVVDHLEQGQIEAVAGRARDLGELGRDLGDAERLLRGDAADLSGWRHAFRSPAVLVLALGPSVAWADASNPGSGGRGSHAASLHLGPTLATRRRCA
jgi:hypothetical protein